MHHPIWKMTHELNVNWISNNFGWTDPWETNLFSMFRSVHTQNLKAVPEISRMPQIRVMNLHPQFGHTQGTCGNTNHPCPLEHDVRCDLTQINLLSDRFRPRTISGFVWTYIYICIYSEMRNISICKHTGHNWIKYLGHNMTQQEEMPMLNLVEPNKYAWTGWAIPPSFEFSIAYTRKAFIELTEVNWTRHICTFFTSFLKLPSEDWKIQQL